jgi:hypothetical protein
MNQRYMSRGKDTRKTIETPKEKLMGYGLPGGEYSEEDYDFSRMYLQREKEVGLLLFLKSFQQFFYFNIYGDQKHQAMLGQMPTMLRSGGLEHTTDTSRFTNAFSQTPNQPNSYLSSLFLSHYKISFFPL